jgi:hypothetical protein
MIKNAVITMNFPEESPMHTIPFNQALQNFIYDLGHERINDKDVSNEEAQTKALDHLIELMQYCVRFDQNDIPKGLRLHPEFFAFSYVEEFFTALFANLHESLFLKAKTVFLRGLSFIVKYIGLPKSREVMYRLMEKLQNRFPALQEMHDKAIATFIEEFFLPTLGEFLDKYKVSEKHLQIAFPAIHELFVASLDTAHDCKLFNFYCNPWIYQPVMDYLAKYPHASECFPLLSAFEGSSYARALPLIQTIMRTTGNVSLKKWTAEQKVSLLLRTFFLRPLVLDTCCVPLPSEEDRLVQRQQATEAVIKNKDWIISILDKATKQLEDSYHCFTTEGQIINKLWVALDLDLSHRLLRDPFSYDDGNIVEVAEKALYETFEPYKTAFAKNNLDISLLLINPCPF